MNVHDSPFVREVDRDLYETVAVELGHLATYCRCDDCPELPLRLRQSLYDARVTRRCRCGDAGCRTVYFSHPCDDCKFNSIAFNMPNFHALVLRYCSNGHVVDVDWLEDASVLKGMKVGRIFENGKRPY